MRDGGSMLTTMMKWSSLLALAGALFFWRANGGYAIFLQFVICGSACLVAFQAVQARRHLWAVAFVGLAIVFNPLMVISLSRSMFVSINVLCFAMFLTSLKALKAAPRLSMPSVTYPGPPNQSL
jgi:hypothetical protein